MGGDRHKGDHSYRDDRGGGGGGGGRVPDFMWNKMKDLTDLTMELKQERDTTKKKLETDTLVKSVAAKMSTGLSKALGFCEQQQQ
jgi:hypothetical protein